jgi:alkaline phosphatase
MNKKTLGILLLLLAALCIIAYIFIGPPAQEPVTANHPFPSETPSQTQASATPVPTVSIGISEPEPERPQPLYVFIMIGDGMGENQRRLAQSYYSVIQGRGSLAMDSLPVSGAITTRSLNARITDSAASATAIATGYKTNNGMLSVTPDGEDLKTILEEAEEKGLSTGIVTTTNLTNATPAAFAAHESKRTADANIALDYIDSGVDFFAGGGAAYFLPASYSGGADAAGAALKSSRSDGENPLARFQENGYLTFIGADGAADFNEYEPMRGDRVFAAFTNSNIPYEADRITEQLNVPTLSQMTQKAIETLLNDEDGFVLMVEGGRIDHACHINDVNSAILETLEFDQAVKAAYEFYVMHPEDTLLIVVADHETGGLGFKADDLKLQYLSGVKASIADRIQKAYKGDREAFYAFIAESLGLGDLNPSERARIEKALDAADKADPKKGYGSKVALAVSKVISGRAGVSWSSTGHTDSPVPLTAAGYMADGLFEAGDNAELGQFLFDVLSSR